MNCFLEPESWTAIQFWFVCVQAVFCICLSERLSHQCDQPNILTDQLSMFD